MWHPVNVETSPSTPVFLSVPCQCAPSPQQPGRSDARNADKDEARPKEPSATSRQQSSRTRLQEFHGGSEIQKGEYREPLDGVPDALRLGA